jgi:hypothetical protein
MKDKYEYILCAAIKRIEPRQDTTMYHNNDICNIEIGYRHHDIIRRFQGEISRNPDDQGFYTSFGRFVGRKEAMVIAMSAGQVRNSYYGRKPLMEAYKDGDLLVKDLFSEDLY